MQQLQSAQTCPVKHGHKHLAATALDATPAPGAGTQECKHAVRMPSKAPTALALRAGSVCTYAKGGPFFSLLAFPTSSKV